MFSLAALFFFFNFIDFGLQKVYKAVINDTTLPSTQLFTVDVMDAMSYGIGGEMSDGFAIDPHTGVVSTTQQIDVGRYEFVITVTVQSGSNLPDIALFVGLVDVLSTGRSIIYTYSYIRIAINNHLCMLATVTRFYRTLNLPLY